MRASRLRRIARRCVVLVRCPLLGHYRAGLQVGVPTHDRQGLRVSRCVAAREKYESGDENGFNEAPCALAYQHSFGPHHDVHRRARGGWRGGTWNDDRERADEPRVRACKPGGCLLNPPSRCAVVVPGDHDLAGLAAIEGGEDFRRDVERDAMGDDRFQRYLALLHEAEGRVVGVEREDERAH